MGGSKKASASGSVPSTALVDAAINVEAGEDMEDKSEGKRDEKNRRACLHAQLRKTKLCMYHLKGTCQYGAHCAFAHTCQELHLSPDLRKTRLCKAFAEGFCDRTDCTFAHGKDELRSTNMFYKKTLCIWHEKDRCRNGDNCRFAHGVEELRPSNPDRQVNRHLNSVHPTTVNQDYNLTPQASRREERSGSGGASSSSTEAPSRDSGGSRSGNSSEDNSSGGGSRRRGGARRMGGGTVPPSVPAAAEAPKRGNSNAEVPPPPAAFAEAESPARLEEPMKIQPFASLPEAMPGTGPVSSEMGYKALVVADLQRLHQEISLLTLKCSQMQQIVSPYSPAGFPLAPQLGAAEEYLALVNQRLLKSANSHMNSLV